MIEAIVIGVWIAALIVFGLPELCEWMNQQSRLRAARVKPVRSRREKLFSFVGQPLWALLLIVGIVVLR